MGERKTEHMTCSVYQKRSVLVQPVV